MLSHFVAPPVGTRSSSPNILKIVTVSFPFEYLTIFSLAHIRNTAVARRNEDIHCKRWLALPAPFPVWTKQMPDNITLGERFWRWWCWYGGLVWCWWITVVTRKGGAGDERLRKWEWFRCDYIAICNRLLHDSTSTKLSCKWTFSGTRKHIAKHAI